MSKEVKRYGYGYVDDGNGNRFLGLIEKPDGNLVKHEDYEALLAERDALKAEQALWEPIHYEIHRRADKMCCLEDQCDFTVEIQHETYAALQGEQP